MGYNYPHDENCLICGRRFRAWGSQKCCKNCQNKRKEERYGKLLPGQSRRDSSKPMYCERCKQGFPYYHGVKLCEECKRQGKYQCPKCLKKNVSIIHGEPCAACYSNMNIVQGGGMLMPLAAVLMVAGLSLTCAGGLNLFNGGNEEQLVIGIFCSIACVSVFFIAYQLKTNLDTKVKTSKEKEISNIECAIGLKSFSGKKTDMQGEYYVYLHYKPSTKDVVYVGKGVGSRDQSEERTLKEHKEMLQSGTLLSHRIMTNVTEKVALEQESYFIGLWGRKAKGGKLFNVQGGMKSPKNYLIEFNEESSQTHHITKEDLENIDNLIEKYIAFLKRSNRSKDYISRLNTHIRKTASENGWKSVTDINPNNFAKWLNEKEFSERGKKKYETSLNSFCSWLVKIGVCSSNPMN
jgi:hypothetical protein